MLPLLQMGSGFRTWITEHSKALQVSFCKPKPCINVSPFLTCFCHMEGVTEGITSGEQAKGAGAHSLFHATDDALVDQARGYMQQKHWEAARTWCCASCLSAGSLFKHGCYLLYQSSEASDNKMYAAGLNYKALIHFPSWIKSLLKVFICSALPSLSPRSKSWKTEKLVVDTCSREREQGEIRCIVKWGKYTM